MKKNIIFIVSIIANIILLVWIGILFSDSVPRHILTPPSEFEFKNIHFSEQKDSYLLTYTADFNGNIPKEVIDIYYPEYKIDVDLRYQDMSITIPLHESIGLEDFMKESTLSFEFEIDKTKLGDTEKSMLSAAANEKDAIVGFALFKVSRLDKETPFLNYLGYCEAK